MLRRILFAPPRASALVDPVSILVLAFAFSLTLSVAKPAEAACDAGLFAPGNVGAEIETSVGTICIELLQNDAPLHVANFLYYLENGLMVDTFFHRLDPIFVLQGGGFRVGVNDYEVIPPLNGPVTNEPCTLDTPAPPPAPAGTMMCSVRGNELGTVALAKTSGDPHSGTTNWFINLDDNRANLDNQNGGFTVFGRVQDMTVVNVIKTMTISNDDDVAWLESAVFPSGLEAPLQQPPLYGTTYGCFDPSDQASVLSLAALPSLVIVGDPLIPMFPFTVSTGCGTPTTLATFTADPGPPGCTDLDRLALRTTGPAPPIGATGSVADFVELTCEQTLEALIERIDWQQDFIGHFNDQLVEITAVPEPSSATGVPLGAALLALLARRRRNGNRTRS
jgi:cyclophilin family peptidyl-prolyl cis-trans isomerase